MNGKYKTLAKDTLIFALGSLGSKVILFFLVPLYTNFLTREEYGISDLVTTLVQLFVPFAAVVINQAVLRFGMKKDRRAEDVLKASFFVLALSVLVSLVFVPLISLYKPMEPWKWYFYALIVLTNISETEKNYLKVKERNRTFAVISIFQTLVLAVTNIVLLTFCHLGISGYLFANIAALAFTTIAAFFAGKIPAGLKAGKLDRTLLREMVRFSFPLIFSTVSWWVIQSSDKLMLELMVGASLLGVYTAATKIPSLINVVTGIFNQAWGLSSIKEIETDKDAGFFSSVFNLFSTFLFGVCIVLTSVIKPFMSVYVGAEFREAWQYTPLLLSAAVFFSISAFIGSVYMALQKTKNDMWTAVLSAVINLAVNYFGIKAWGIWGAVLGTVSAYLVIALIRVIDIRRQMRFDVDVLRFVINCLIMLVHSVFVSLNLNILLVSISAVILFFILNFGNIKQICTKLLSFVRRR
ncbi:lipopolysaccharide biosynthesis protein [Butyrivibrio sp. AE2032]|uniref:lipopolysaccharide biosynthesis protein n=1 Tax=Butyrivibrio sp. AE2032 TaxID=1458463 RepID=UPI00054FFD1C|nr:oligosaccharide flippase family protein [Butyrivibrio sp. AE2032]